MRIPGFTEPVHGEVWEGHRLASPRMARRDNQRRAGPRRQRANRIGMVGNRHDRWRFGVETMRPTSTVPSPLSPLALSCRCVNPRPTHWSRFRFRDKRAGTYLPPRCSAPGIFWPVPSRRHTFQRHVKFGRLV